jgi:DNA (cytosine-5)-methyltransferase 1
LFSSKNYYNENDKFAAKWLKALIEHGLIPNGDVDDRSITDVKPEDLRGYTQCHFFAGIGGWPRALSLAGWGADRPVWSGSCPCQPLSCAGKQKGADDERHLWPAFYGLIRECKPSVVFGEQVASKLGLEWLAGIRLDLEAAGYAVGAADLCAASVGSPHIRSRLFWVAESELARRQKTGKRYEQQTRDKPEPGCGDIGFWSTSVAIPCADGKWRRVPGRVGNTSGQRLKTINGEITGNPQQSCGTSFDNGERQTEQLEIEPALFPLAYGICNRVGLLRGAGNAIVPQVAAEFIRAFMDED